LSSRLIPEASKCLRNTSTELNSANSGENRSGSIEPERRPRKEANSKHKKRKKVVGQP